MRESLLEVLRCPVDIAPLTLEVETKEADGHIMSGSLKCSLCHQQYTIQNGVPVMLPERMVFDLQQNIQKLQLETQKRFGFEWKYFRDWGWYDQYPEVPGAEELFYGSLKKNSESAFWSKTLFKTDEITEDLSILDAGCGNGRFTYQAALSGAQVIGIDLGEGVYSAFEHMRTFENVHIVQGDIFRLPFPNSCFDRAFSIGVLMHTGDAAKAFDSIVRVLGPEGLLAVRIYGSGRRSYEFIDASIRTVTTRLPISLQMGFAGLTARLTRWLQSGGKRRTRLYYRLFSIVNLLPTDHHMFDWWSAPIATHHHPQEVLSWFEKNGITLLRFLPDLDPVSELERRTWHRPITALGRLDER